MTAVVAEPVESAPVPEAETVQNGKLTIKFDNEPAFLICVFFWWRGLLVELIDLLPLCSSLLTNLAIERFDHCVSIVGA